MNEVEFHAKRRMFFIIGDRGIILAAEDDNRSHYEYLASMFGSTLAGEYYATMTRGYYLDGRVVAYKGQDFEHWVNHDGLVEVAKVFDSIYATTDIDNRRVPGVREIGIGINKASIGKTQPWEPKILEDIDDYLTKIAQKIEMDKKKETPSTPT